MKKISILLFFLSFSLWALSENTPLPPAPPDTAPDAPKAIPLDSLPTAKELEKLTQESADINSEILQKRRELGGDTSEIAKKLKLIQVKIFEYGTRFFQEKNFELAEKCFDNIRDESPPVAKENLRELWANEYLGDILFAFSKPPYNDRYALDRALERYKMALSRAKDYNEHSRDIELNKKLEILNNLRIRKFEEKKNQEKQDEALKKQESENDIRFFEMFLSGKRSCDECNFTTEMHLECVKILKDYKYFNTSQREVLSQGLITKYDFDINMKVVKEASGTKLRAMLKWQSEQKALLKDMGE